MIEFRKNKNGQWWLFSTTVFPKEWSHVYSHLILRGAQRGAGSGRSIIDRTNGSRLRMATSFFLAVARVHCMDACMIVISVKFGSTFQKARVCAGRLIERAKKKSWIYLVLAIYKKKHQICVLYIHIFGQTKYYNKLVGKGSCILKNLSMFWKQKLKLSIREKK